MNIGKILKSIAAFLAEFFKPLPPAPDPLPPVPDPEPLPPKPDGEADDNTWLWKPETDTLPRRACVITPAKLDLESVTVCYGAKQKKCEIAAYRGPRANGNRQHWMLNSPGKYYGKRIKVVGLDRKLQTEHKWNVADGAARVEIR